jgi:AcrR family transcriptional regulator
VPHQSTAPTGAEDSTPSRLLDATERLVGEQGVDGVSLRAINAAANSNVAAAHYHFGSKEALVAAALQRRMGPLAADRLAMLDQMEKARRPPVRGIVEIFVLPLARFCETEEGRHYVRFLAALDRSGQPWRGLVRDSFAPQWARIEPVLTRALPDLTDEVRRFRFSVAGSTVLEVLAYPERHLASADGVPTSTEAVSEVVPDLIDLITGALAAPSTSRRYP